MLLMDCALQTCLFSVVACVLIHRYPTSNDARWACPMTQDMSVNLPVVMLNFLVEEYDTKSVDYLSSEAIAQCGKILR